MHYLTDNYEIFGYKNDQASTNAFVGDFTPHHRRRKCSTEFPYGHVESHLYSLILLRRHKLLNPWNRINKLQ